MLIQEEFLLTDTAHLQLGGSLGVKELLVFIVYNLDQLALALLGDKLAEVAAEFAL